MNGKFQDKKLVVSHSVVLEQNEICTVIYAVLGNSFTVIEVSGCKHFEKFFE